MVSMSCLLSLPPRPRPESSQPASHLQLHLPAFSSESASTVRGHTETNMASAALGNCTSSQFLNQGLVAPWPGPAVRIADRLNRYRESEVRQMVRSRESKRLAIPPLPPASLLLERQAPAVSNLLSSQASSFKSDEICYQGRMCFCAVRNFATTVSILSAVMRGCTTGTLQLEGAWCELHVTSLPW